MAVTIDAQVALTTDARSVTGEVPTDRLTRWEQRQ
jgi:hypothetical protein